MDTPRETPSLEEIDDRLDQALEDTFPSSDPVSIHPDSDPTQAKKEIDPPLPEDQADGAEGIEGPPAEGVEP